MNLTLGSDPDKVLHSEQPNPMAADVVNAVNSKKRGGRGSRNNSSSCNTAHGRGRGHGGKLGSSTRAPTGLCGAGETAVVDTSMLTAALKGSEIACVCLLRG